MGFENPNFFLAEPLSITNPKKSIIALHYNVLFAYVRWNIQSYVYLSIHTGKIWICLPTLLPDVNWSKYLRDYEGKLNGNNEKKFWVLSPVSPKLSL